MSARPQQLGGDDPGGTSTIVLVDDHDSTRTGLAQLLASHEYRVLAVSGFDEAREILARQGADLLITDVRLGGRNGIQLLATAPPHLAAIVLTGYDDPVLAREAQELGAAFLVKPCSPAILLHAVHAQLARPDRVQSNVPVRQWGRRRIGNGIAVEVGGVSGWLRDVSYGGAAFETVDIPRIGDATTVKLSDTEAGVVAFSFRILWHRKLENGRWVSGGSVLAGQQELWRSVAQRLS